MLGQGYASLTLEEPAPLRKNLIFKMHGRRARRLVLPHGALGVDGVAVARIGVGDHRNPHGVGDVAQIADHFRHAGKAHVRQADLSRSSVARHVDRLCAFSFGDERGEPVVDERGQNHAVRHRIS